MFRRENATSDGRSFTASELGVRSRMADLVRDYWIRMGVRRRYPHGPTFGSSDLLVLRMVVRLLRAQVEESGCSRPDRVRSNDDNLSLRAEKRGDEVVDLSTLRLALVRVLSERVQCMERNVKPYCLKKKSLLKRKKIFFGGHVETKKGCMPYKYVHSDVTRDTPKTFECTLECRQCTASKLDGEQCKRNVCIWLPFCWQHTQNMLGVKISNSKALPGSLGMFAVKGFKKGELIAPYGGEILSQVDVKKRYGLVNEYSLGPYLLYSVDSACVRFVASAANGAFGSIPSSSSNVYFDKTCHRFGTEKKRGDTFNGLVLSRDNLGIKYWSIASRDILPGEEILANYGEYDYDSAFARREEKCKRFGVECDRTERIKASKK